MARQYATTAPAAPRYQRRLVSAVPGRGNPKTVENLPSTAAEMEANPQPEQADEGTPSASASATPETLRTSYTGDGSGNDWSRSYHGLSAEPFPKEVAEVLQAPIDPLDIEIKPGVWILFMLRSPTLILIRRPDLSSGNQVQTHLEQGIRAGRLGFGTEK